MTTPQEASLEDPRNRNPCTDAFRHTFPKWNSAFFRLGVVAVGGLLHAVAFPGVGTSSLETPSAFLSHLGAVFFLCQSVLFLLTLSFIDAQRTIPLFLQEFSSSKKGIVRYALSITASDVAVSFVQAAIFNTITYFTMDLQGDFGFWFLATILFAQTQLAFGHMVAAILPKPSQGQELAPVILLTSALFSGILVSTDTFPSWTAWVQVILPFTYFSRLILSNEFSQCLEFTQEEARTVGCVTSFQNALHLIGAIDGDSLASVVTNTSQVAVAHTGTYNGPTQIKEYNTYVSPAENPDSTLWRVCNLKGHLLVKLNSATGNNTCDVTIATIMQTQFNQNEIRDDLRDSGESWIEFVKGRRIKYTHPDDLSGMEFLNYDLYFPEPTIELEGESMDKFKRGQYICEIMGDKCNHVFTANNFTSQEDCASQMAALPATTINEKGVETIDGNSLGCRRMHASFAATNSNHCPHLSLFPMEDENGYLICQDEGEKNASPRDYFDPSDYDMFNYMAGLSGIDRTNHYRLLKEDELSQCASNFVELGGSTLSIMGLPDTLFCASTLVARDATGVNNATYWMVLFGMFFFFRVTAFLTLGRKASLATNIESPANLAKEEREGVHQPDIEST